jgi:hypothetical protein
MKRRGLLLALTGYATSGKDAFADCLVEKYHYTKFGWADAIYSFCLDINPYIWRPAWNKWPWQRLADIVGEIGWTEAKKIKQVRELLQLVGTSAREHMGEDVWVNALIPKVKKVLQTGGHVAITNTRFKNEARAVAELDGNVVKISRPGVGPVNSHISDAGEAFRYAIAEVENEGSIEELAEKASHVHETLLAEATGDKDALVHPELYVVRMQQTVDRSMAMAIRTIVSIAAPEHVELDDYIKRHRVAIHEDEDGITQVGIDGELAGEVLYEDGVLTMDAFIAR